MPVPSRTPARQGVAMSRCRHATLLSVIALSVPALGAADFVQWTSTRDWYVSVGVTQAPDEIEEESSGPGGESTYEWRGIEDSVAPRLAIGHLACSGGSQGGWTLGIEGVISTCEVTPSRYHVDGLTFSNTSDDTLRYSTLGVTVFGGYQFGINPDHEAISSFLVIGPFIGAGAAYADSEVRDQNGTYQSDSGVGWYVEGGLRGGFFITEKRWLLGVFVDFMIGTGEVDIDFGDDTDSTLTHERIGLAGSLVAGYRL
jgi:hypothetical protein